MAQPREQWPDQTPDDHEQHKGRQNHQAEVDRRLGEQIEVEFAFGQGAVDHATEDGGEILELIAELADHSAGHVRQLLGQGGLGGAVDGLFTGGLGLLGGVFRHLSQLFDQLAAGLFVFQQVGQGRVGRTVTGGTARAAGVTALLGDGRSREQHEREHQHAEESRAES